MADRPIVFIIDGERIYAVSDYFLNIAKDPTLQQTNGLLNNILKSLTEYGSTSKSLKDILDKFNAVSDEDEVRVDPYQTIDTETEELIIDGTALLETDSLDFLTPSSGKKIQVRDWLLMTDSSRGKIWLKFKNSGKVIGALYTVTVGGSNRVDFSISSSHTANIISDTDEPIELSWDGLDLNSRIFVQVNYKEV